MRIGVNVPDDLLKRLESLKAVTKINVSEICRDAIKRHVDTYERAVKQASEDGMSVFAERLGNMLLPSEVDWELLGIEDAKTWVQKATLEDFEYLLHRLEVFERSGRSPYEVPIPRVQGVKFFEERSHEHDEWFDRQIEADEESNPFIEAKLIYQRGKLSYILVVWNTANEMANEKRRKALTALHNARIEARKRVDVPDKLSESLK